VTSVDQLPHHLTLHLMYGHGSPDPEHRPFADFMSLILGGNPLASNSASRYVPDVEKRLRRFRRAANW
jgi:hypothetical protein